MDVNLWGHEASWLQRRSNIRRTSVFAHLFPLRGLRVEHVICHRVTRLFNTRPLANCVSVEKDHLCSLDCKSRNERCPSRKQQICSNTPPSPPATASWWRMRPPTSLTPPPRLYLLRKSLLISQQVVSLKIKILDEAQEMLDWRWASVAVGADG